MRFLYETRSIDEHTQLWWSVRPHLAFPTVEIRICDAQPDLGEARSLAALCLRAHRAHRARRRRGRAAAVVPAPADRGEPLARDPLRALRRADRPRERRRASRRAPTSSGSSSGCCPWPRSSAAPRRSQSPRPTPRSARSPGTKRARASRRSTPSKSRPQERRSVADDEQKLIDELQAELAKLKVADLLLQTLYSVSSLGYHRLTGETTRPRAGEARDRGLARAPSRARGIGSRRGSARLRPGAREPPARVRRRSQGARNGYSQDLLTATAVIENRGAGDSRRCFAREAP